MKACGQKPQVWVKIHECMRREYCSDDEFLLKFGITVVVVGHPCEEHAVRS